MSRVRARTHVAVKIAALALAFRAGSAALAFLANVVFPDFQREQFTVFGSTSLFWDSFARYDSGWYYQIARNGYQYTPGGRGSIAFFPVYPFLMRHVGRAFGRTPSDLYIGGLLVSVIAFVVAMVALYYLARLDMPSRRAERAPLVAAVFPFAFFFGAVYSEAVFLAAVVGSFYLFRTRRWLAGGVCGAIATATRVNGILIWPALAWIAWRTLWPRGGAVPPGDPPRRERLQAVAGLLLLPAGIGAYSLYIYQTTGNPLEWAVALQRWEYYPGGSPWLALVRLVQAFVSRPYLFLAEGTMAPYDLLNGLTALVFVAAVPFVWVRLGAAYGFYLAANLWLPLSSGQYEGLGRYCAVLFPCFIWVASWRSRTAVTAVVVGSAMLYMLCMALFANIHPLF